MKSKKGFTLIEVLIVIGIIAILSAIVIIAINPARQFAQARNTTRWTAVNAILNAVGQNMVDNMGVFTCAASLPASATNIADPITDPTGVNLCACLSPTYVATMPFDPRTGSYTTCATYDTQYSILQDGVTGRVTVSAPDAELGVAISVTR